MRSLLFAGLAACFIMAGLTTLFVGLPRADPDTSETLTQETVERAQVFPREPVKKDARLVGGEGFGTVEVEDETIARLPAKPVPPKPESSSTPTPVQLNRPLIEHPGELQSRDYHVRLADIVSPGLEATCGAPSKSSPCGREARTALRSFIRGRTVICTVADDRERNVGAAQCTVGGKDVAEWLVKHGWAVASDGSRYEAIMTNARENELGLWRDGANAKRFLQPVREQADANN